VHGEEELRPQKKNVSAIPSGMTDQAISSRVEPSMGRGRSSWARRRYLIAKTMTRIAITSEKKALTARR
jgi:hypothetical protein